LPDVCHFVFSAGIFWLESPPSFGLPFQTCRGYPTALRKFRVEVQAWFAQAPECHFSYTFLVSLSRRPKLQPGLLREQWLYNRFETRSMESLALILAQKDLYESRPFGSGYLRRLKVGLLQPSPGTLSTQRSHLLYTLVLLFSPACQTPYWILFNFLIFCLGFVVFLFFYLRAFKGFSSWRAQMFCLPWEQFSYLFGFSRDLIAD